MGALVPQHLSVGICDIDADVQLDFSYYSLIKCAKLILVGYESKNISAER